MAWLLPELDDGAEPELKPLELEPEFELDPVEVEPDEVEPVELEPVEPVEVEPELVEPELEDEPELDELPDEPVDVEADALLCVDPGRVSATMPAAATLAMVTVVVVDRTLDRPRSLSAMARRMRSRCALLMCLILRSRTRSVLQESSRLAMRVGALLSAPGPRLTCEHEGLLKPARTGTGMGLVAHMPRLMGLVAHAPQLESVIIWGLWHTCPAGRWLWSTHPNSGLRDLGQSKRDGPGDARAARTADQAEWPLAMT